MRKAILILFVILISCKTETKKEVASAKNSSKVLGKKYFNYDEIIHYNNNIPETDVWKINEDRKLSIRDSLKNEIILGYKPESISDSSFINNLIDFGYKKIAVKSNKFSAIDSIFSAKEIDVIDAACVHVYRDILVFKKQNKTVGVAKICFHCQDSRIVGNEIEKMKINQYEDYQKLETLLK